MARGKPTFAETMEQVFARPLTSRTIIRSVDDHKITWPRDERSSDALPPFPFHVYVIRRADALVVDEILTDKLLCYMHHGTDLGDARWHLEVCAIVQDTVFACVDHYEQEMAVRKVDCDKPSMPNNKSFLVVDSETWDQDGLLLVSYSYDSYMAHSINADRYKSWSFLGHRLQEQWNDLGRAHIEEELDDRNLARGWPIDWDLYDADGPKRSNDDEPAPQTSLPSAHEALDIRTILGSQNLDIDDIVEDQHQDHGGAPYTALRHSSSQPPLFTFCLFVLGRNTSSNDRLSIFARLNKDMLASVSWILHLYSDATMSSAYTLFTQDMASRDYPGHIPSDYSGFPLQEHRNIYMCLEPCKAPSSGPSFVLSASVPDLALSSKLDEFRYYGQPDYCELTTFDLESWDLAPDLLHTYFVVCSESRRIPRPLSPPLPRISVRLSVKSEYSSNSSIPSPMDLFITSYAIEPITLNVRGTIFDTLYWQSYIRIAHAESLLELPKELGADQPYRPFSRGPQILDYGFTRRSHGQGDEESMPPHLVTLRPSIPVQLPVQRSLLADPVAGLRPDENENENDKSSVEGRQADGETEAHLNPAEDTWRSLYKRYEGSWEVGSKYIVEMRPGVTIPRWTWGSQEHLKVPYGLPVLEVEVEEGGNREFVLTN